MTENGQDQVTTSAARLPRARVRRKGFLSQPLPFGRCVHLARGDDFVAVTWLTKTATYPAMPQYRTRGLILRWSVSHGVL